MPLWSTPAHSPDRTKVWPLSFYYLRTDAGGANLPGSYTTALANTSVYHAALPAGELMRFDAFGTTEWNSGIEATYFSDVWPGGTPTPTTWSVNYPAASNGTSHLYFADLRQENATNFLGNYTPNVFGAGDKHAFLWAENPTYGQQLVEVIGYNGVSAACESIVTYDLTDYTLPTGAEPSGVVAARFPIAPFHFTYADLVAAGTGDLGHMLGWVAANYQNASQWPARATDGTLTGGPYLKAGSVIRLSSSWTIPAGWPETLKVVARTMQRYGIVLYDKNGSKAIVGTVCDPSWPNPGLFSSQWGAEGPLLSDFEEIDISGYKIANDSIQISGSPVVGPTASFTRTPTSGTAPLSVSFTDTSVAGTGTITGWAWDFGDGNTSTSQNPTHVYSVAGSYTVNLTVTDSNAMSDAAPPLTVTVSGPVGPTASFNRTPSSGNPPLTVSCTDTSVAGSSPIVSWYWTFGNGNVSTVQNPTAGYYGPGTYTINLTVTDANGFSDTATPKTVIVNPPGCEITASFTPSVTSGEPPLSVTFTDTSTVAQYPDYPGPIVYDGSHVWTISVGGTAGNPGVELGKIDPATRQVVATVPIGPCLDLLAVGGYVYASTNTTIYKVDATTATVVGTVTFTGYANQMTWDGTSVWANVLAGPDPIIKFDPTTLVATPVSVAGGGVGNVYYAAGHVWAVVDGVSDTIVKIDPTTNLTVATIPWTGATAPYGMAYDGTYLWITSPGFGDDFAMRIDPATDTLLPTTYPWSGFDIQYDAGDNVLYVCGDQITNPPFNDPFVYQVNAATGALLDSVAYPVGAPSPKLTIVGAELWVTSGPTFPSPGSSYTGSIAIYDRTTMALVYTLTSCGLQSWLWNFGDGNTSTDQNPTHTYSVAGTYNVTLTVSNCTDCTDISPPTQIVVGLQPECTFTPEYPFGPCIGAPVAIQITTVPALSGDYARVNWNNGDAPEIYNAPHPAVISSAGYNALGNYTAVIELWDGYPDAPGSTLICTGNVPFAITQTTCLPCEINTLTGIIEQGNCQATLVFTVTQNSAVPYPWTYTVDWGDTTTTPGGPETGTQTVTETHSYTGTGTWTVTVNITALDGLITSTCVGTVSCCPPPSMISAMDTNCLPGAMLGVGSDLRVFLTTQGATQIIAELQPTSGYFTRDLDATSELEVTGIVTGKLDEVCCDGWADAYPWFTEVIVYRDGRDAWSGPVTNVEFGYGTVTIKASDLTAWWSRRVVTNLSLTGVDVATVFTAVHDNAMAPDPIDNFTISPTATGILATRSYKTSDYQYAKDILDELSKTGIDWTCYGRTVLIGGETVPANPYFTLLDDFWTEPPKVVSNGDNQATRVIVRGKGVTGVATAPASYLSSFGLLTRVFDESEIADQASVTAAAATRLALLKDQTYIVTPSGAALTPNAPVRLEELVPGIRVRVTTEATCRPVTADFRLKKVRVDFTGQVSIDLQPLGTDPDAA